MARLRVTFMMDLHVKTRFREFKATRGSSFQSFGFETFNLDFLAWGMLLFVHNYFDIGVAIPLQNRVFDSGSIIAAG